MSDSPVLAKGMEGPAAPEIDADLINAMQEARKALVAAEMKAIADRAWALLTTPPDMPTVVIVGEVKRGKSSLVNSLLGRPDASPVGVDIVTSAFVRFVPVSESAADGDTALLYAGGRRRVIDQADLPGWVTVEGRHVTDPKINELPIGAEVAMTSQFLPRAALVDTPGVGGLNPSHLRLVKAATERASILLMTCDAKQPITASELTFLKSISQDVDSVVIAVTKIDQEPLTWRSIMDENRRLLTNDAPRFADAAILGVSSVIATYALQMPPGEQRDSTLRDSGLPELVERLDATCSSGDQLHIANGLRTARSGLEAITRRLANERSALDKGAAASAELNEEKQRLAALQKESAGGWRDYLTADLAALRSKTLAPLDHKLNELNQQWRERLDNTKLRLLRHPQVFIAEMTADLEALVAEVSDEYLAGVAKLTEELALNAEVKIGGISTTVRGDYQRKRFEGVLSPQLASYASTGWRTVGGAAMAIGLGPGVVPVAILAGAWVVVNLGYQAMKMGRLNLQQWLNNTAAAVKSDATREIQDMTDAIRPVIINAYKDQLSDSMAQLKKLIETAENAAKASQAERIDAVAELDAKREALNKTIAAVDAQLARLLPVTVLNSPSSGSTQPNAPSPNVSA